jgi:hypothetical protein
MAPVAISNGKALAVRCHREKYAVQQDGDRETCSVASHRLASSPFGSRLRHFDYLSVLTNAATASI